MNLSNKIETMWFKDIMSPLYKDKGITIDNIRKAIKELRKRMWEHNKTFIGIKNKTCLPLDYIDLLLYDIFGEKLIDEVKA
jgi:hypothetical protein